MEAGSEKTWIEVREEQRRWEDEGWQWNKNDRKKKRRRRVGIKQIGWRWAEWKWREGRNERRGGGEGGERREEEGGSRWPSVGAVWMLIRRFCRFTYACSNRLPCSDWGSLVYGEKTKILQSIMYEAHTHTHYFSAHTQHQPLWRHHSGTRGAQTHTDAIADTHQGIQIIYLQYGTCIAGPRGVSRVRRRVRNSTALHLCLPSLLNCTQQKNANQQRDDVHLSRRLRRSIPTAAPSGISRRAPSLLMEFCSRPPEETCFFQL